MKKLKFIILACAFLIAQSAVQAQPAFKASAEEASSDISTDNEAFEGGDLFPGTVSFEKGRYILKRCSSGGYSYILDFTDTKLTSQLDQLLRSKTKFWVNVLGIYSEVNGEHHLKVKHELTIQRGESCQLTDFLDSLVNDE